MADTTTKRDGFEVVNFETGEVVKFIACTKNDRMRERVEAGLLLNMNTETYFVRDTREEA